jgi:hypothetical protein
MRRAAEGWLAGESAARPLVLVFDDLHWGDSPTVQVVHAALRVLARLRVAAVRTALNVLEKMDERLAHDSVALDRAGGGPDPEQETVGGDQRAIFREVLEEAVSALPAQQRTALRLHFVEALTGDEIGERLGISRATVVRWLSTARAFLLRETKRLLTSDSACRRPKPIASSRPRAVAWTSV